MKTCVGCKYAKWNVSKNGRISPKGEGHCEYKIKIPELPRSFNYTIIPSIVGGYINRREEFKKDCIYYVHEEKI